MKSIYNDKKDNKNGFLLVGLGLLGGVALLQNQRTINQPIAAPSSPTTNIGPIFRTRFGGTLVMGAGDGLSDYDLADFTATQSPNGAGMVRTEATFTEVRTQLYVEMDTLPLALGESIMCVPVAVPAVGAAIPLSLGATLDSTTILPVGSRFVVLDSGWGHVLNFPTGIEIGTFISSQRAYFMGAPRQITGWVDIQFR